MVCFENRNGVLVAFDAATRTIPTPAGDVPRDRFLSDDCRYLTESEVLADLDLDAIREALEARGIEEVYVYDGTKPTWLGRALAASGQKARIVEFFRAAASARHQRGVWRAVPASRLGDGESLFARDEDEVVA